MDHVEIKREVGSDDDTDDDGADACPPAPQPASLSPPPARRRARESHRSDGAGKGRRVTDYDCQEFLASLAATDEDIERAAACEQRTPEWFRWRDSRLSASQFGAAAGHNEHRGTGDVLLAMLWPDFNPEGDGAQRNEALIYGTVMEAHAIDVVRVGVDRHYRALGYRSVWIEETGTRICREHPWLCASSDGLIFAIGGPSGSPDPLRGTLENKCPYLKKRFYPRTPHAYYDQFQGCAAILGVDNIVFSVYTPSETQLNYFPFKRAYWERDLFPKLRRFYMAEYLPRAILKRRGLIGRGRIDPDPYIILSPAIVATAFALPAAPSSDRATPAGRDLDAEWEKTASCEPALSEAR